MSTRTFLAAIGTSNMKWRTAVAPDSENHCVSTAKHAGTVAERSSIAGREWAWQRRSDTALRG